MKAIELSNEDWIIINDCLSWSVEMFEELPATHPRRKSSLKIRNTQLKVHDIYKEIATNERRT